MRGCRVACTLALSMAFAAAAAGDAPGPAFIERTLVIAPHQVGDFLLEGSRYDPANRFAGVSLRYRLPGNEETRIDLFVYPYGQGETEAVLDHGMRDFRATLEAAEQAGHYRGMAVSEAVELDIPLPSALADAPPPAAADSADAPPRSTGDDAADGDRLAVLATLLGADRRVDGRMIELAFDMRGVADGEWLPMRSRGYLLYRHLHFFKSRISAAAHRIDQAAFAALADRAVRELVPAVQAYNIGGCGDSTIHVDSTLETREMADMLMRQLAAAQARSEASNCHRAPDDAVLAALSEDAEVVAIEYAPDDWRTH